MNMDVLLNSVGTYNAEFDCLYTVYLAYPELPRYEIRQDKDYIKTAISAYFKPVDVPQTGDLLLFWFRGGFHFGVAVDSERFAHCCKIHKLRISSLVMYQKYLRGVYRWRQ